MSLFFLFCFVFYWGLRVIPLAQVRDGGFFNKMKGVFALGYDRLSSVKCSSFCVNNILNIYIQRVTTWSEQASVKAWLSENYFLSTLLVVSKCCILHSSTANIFLRGNLDSFELSRCFLSKCVWKICMSELFYDPFLSSS